MDFEEQGGLREEGGPSRLGKGIKGLACPRDSDPAQGVPLLTHPLAKDKHQRQSQQHPQKLRRQLGDAGSRREDLAR